MRVNIYAEEMTQHVEIVEKTVGNETFTGLRIYLALPATLPNGAQVKGPFIHRAGDDDSSAVTFWGKRDLMDLLFVMQRELQYYYLSRQGKETARKQDGEALGLEKKV